MEDKMKLCSMMTECMQIFMCPKCSLACHEIHFPVFARRARYSRSVLHNTPKLIFYVFVFTTLLECFSGWGDVWTNENMERLHIQETSFSSFARRLRTALKVLLFYHLFHVPSIHCTIFMFFAASAQVF